MITKRDFLIRVNDAMCRANMPNGQMAFACSPSFMRALREGASPISEDTPLPDGFEEAKAEMIETRFIVSPFATDLIVFAAEEFDKVKAALDVLGGLKENKKLEVA